MGPPHVHPFYDTTISLSLYISLLSSATISPSYTNRSLSRREPNPTMATTTLLLRHALILRSHLPEYSIINTTAIVNRRWRWFPAKSSQPIRHRRRSVLHASSRAADDSAPFEMSVESALKLLGVSEGASFEEILRAKNSILATCKDDDQQAVAQVEAAYDMLLMQSLSQRRAGKVVDSKIRYADVRPVNSPGMGSMPQWLQTTVKNAPISIETPSTKDLGIEAGVYGALMALTYVNGASASGSPYASADVPGLILATSFGTSLYFMTKKNVKLGKAAIITIGGLVAGAVVGSAVENLLQVDIVPFLGIHSPAVVVSEFILFSQFLVSLYLR